MLAGGVAKQGSFERNYRTLAQFRKYDQNWQRRSGKPVLRRNSNHVAQAGGRAQVQEQYFLAADRLQNLPRRVSAERFLPATLGAGRKLAPACDRQRPTLPARPGGTDVLRCSGGCALKPIRTSFGADRFMDRPRIPPIVPSQPPGVRSASGHLSSPRDQHRRGRPWPNPPRRNRDRRFG
jgi:hypothetical protein